MFYWHSVRGRTGATALEARSRSTCTWINMMMQRYRPRKQGAVKLKLRPNCQNAARSAPLFFCCWSDMSWISNTVHFLQKLAPSRCTSAKHHRVFVFSCRKTFSASWQRRHSVWNGTGVKGVSEHSFNSCNMWVWLTLRLLSNLIFESNGFWSTIVVLVEQRQRLIRTFRTKWSRSSTHCD